MALYDWIFQFLSTPSARRATCTDTLHDGGGLFLSTPSARRATRGVFGGVPAFGFLSTPSARRATIIMLISGDTAGFLSTPSARRATGLSGCVLQVDLISIHALREEGDDRQRIFGYFRRDFYPRPPRGGRPFSCYNRYSDRCISIHALREEGDQTNYDNILSHQHFYPRPPRGGRQQKQRQNLYFQTNYTTFCTNLEEP